MKHDSSMLNTLRAYNIAHSQKVPKSLAEKEEEIDKMLPEIFIRVESASSQDPSLNVIPHFYFEQSSKLSIKARQLAIHHAASEQVLSPDQLEQLWDLLQQHNEDLDDKIDYETFNTVGQACINSSANFRCYFEPNVFLNFHKDTKGKISLEAFYLYVCKKVQRQQVLLKILPYDANGEGYLREQDLRKFIADQLKSNSQLAKLNVQYHPYYVTHEGSISFITSDSDNFTHIKDLLKSSKSVLFEFNELSGKLNDKQLQQNWFSSVTFLQYYDQFVRLDSDRNKRLSRKELAKFNLYWTDTWLERIFQEYPSEGGELTYADYTDLMLVTLYNKTEESLAYCWKLLDVQKTGKITLWTLHFFFKSMVEKAQQNKMEIPKFEDIKDEIFDMVKPADPLHITLKDLKHSKVGHIVVAILSDCNGLWAYDHRETLPPENVENE